MLNWYRGKQHPCNLLYKSVVADPLGKEVLGVDVIPHLREDRSHIFGQVFPLVGSAPVSGSTGKVVVSQEDGYTVLGMMVSLPKDVGAVVTGFRVMSSVGAHPDYPDDPSLILTFELLEGLSVNPDSQGVSFWVKWNPVRETLFTNLYEVQRDV